jgi:hypothetical protein
LNESRLFWPLSDVQDLDSVEVLEFLFVDFGWWHGLFELFKIFNYILDIVGPFKIISIIIVITEPRHTYIRYCRPVDSGSGGPL